ncbi:hypothetical protein F2P56_025042 [Juglans regia]|uniref:Protein kinase domain-containing protein n=2 Tax=Juglans regia TaxID=51240 RepID=A0A833X359_JUGRE|nr:uncharacterized protein LOC108999805 isoform X4 [Juglans regia]KAF5455471.1 hypothetical protein F2P56_025042 [Juglans regia]
MALAAVGNMEHNGQQFFFKEQQLSVDFSVAIMQSPKGRSIDFSVAISLRFHLGPSQTVPASPTQQDLLPKSKVGTPGYIAPEVLSRREYDGNLANVMGCG